MKTLHTPRLTLSLLTEHDAPFILELLNDPAWLTHIGNRDVNDLEGARGYIQMGPKSMYQRGLGLMKVSADDMPVGLCGLMQRAYLSCPDVGYAFLPGGRGKGYAKEATKAVKEAFLARSPNASLAGLVSPQNTPSIRVLESLGMTFQREFLAPGESRRTALYLYGAQKGVLIEAEVSLL